MGRSPHAFSSDFDPEAFDVAWFNDAADVSEGWVEKPKQADIWTPAVPQNEPWTRNYDE